MSRMIIKILDVHAIPGRQTPLVVFDIVRGEASDFSQTNMFAASDASGAWSLVELALADSPNSGREAAGFLRVSGQGELHSGMELIQADANISKKSEPLATKYSN